MIYPMVVYKYFLGIFNVDTIKTKPNYAILVLWKT